MYEHVERERREEPERDERRPHAIAELDAAGLGRGDGNDHERYEEIEPAPEEASELVQIAVDRDRPVPEDAVTIVDELALDPNRLEEAGEAPVGKRAREDPEADQSRDRRRRQPGGRDR